MNFTVLLDAPDHASSRLQVAKLGSFKDGRYGEFDITPDDIQSWQRNLAALPGGRALIDLDHRADRSPRNTEAAGWITGVDLVDGTPMAEVEWTPVGRQAIEEKRYLFFSPTYGEHTDETGHVHENTLIGGALTNRPFLGMPAITLASDERVSEAVTNQLSQLLDEQLTQLDGMLHLDDGDVALIRQLDISAADRRQAAKDGTALPDGSYPIRSVKELRAAATLAASGHGDVKTARALIRRRAKALGVDVTTLPGFAAKTPDSRRTMDKQLLTALGLDQDTELAQALETVDLDETASRKLLDAATALKTKATAAPATPPAPAEPVKTLEQQAAETGKVLLDAERFTKLERDATLGAAASLQLHEQRFDHAFEQAIKDRKVTPAERDSLHHFYTLDADATITAIEARQPVLPEKPAGHPVLELDTDTPVDPRALAEAGVHPGAHQSYAKVQKRMKELDLPQSEFQPTLVKMMEAGEI